MEETKRTPEQLAEIWVFEHVHDAFGLSVQDGFIGGYNAGIAQSPALLAKVSEQEKEIENIRNKVLDEAIAIFDRGSWSAEQIVNRLNKLKNGI